MGRTSSAKQRLITAMADLVHRKGYEAVGVEEVCRTAGVKKGSFYHFFASKRDLMIAALEDRWNMATAYVVPQAFNRSLPPLARLARFFSHMADLETANQKAGGAALGCPFGNIAAEVGTSEPLLARRADQAFCGLASLIRDTLTEAKASGDIDKRLDVNEAADAIVAYFEGLSLLSKVRNDPSIIGRLGKRAVQLALTARPPDAPQTRKLRRRR